MNEVKYTAHTVFQIFLYRVQEHNFLKCRISQVQHGSLGIRR